MSQSIVNVDEKRKWKCVVMLGLRICKGTEVRFDTGYGRRSRKMEVCYDAREGKERGWKCVLMLGMEVGCDNEDGEEGGWKCDATLGME